MTPIHILLAEDEALLAKDIEHKVTRMGYTFAGYAVSGEMAVTLAYQQRPGIVLMDIRLRGQMDGIEAAQRIHDELDIPIIFITAYADDETLQRAKTTEPYGYILKPVEPRELSIMIEMAAYKHAAEKERLRQLQRLSAIRAIDQAILTQQDFTQTLRVALEQIVSNLKLSAAAILLCNPYTQTLSYAAQYGLGEAVLSLDAQPVGIGYAGQVASREEAIFTAALRGFYGQRYFSHYGALPMICKGHVLGVLEVYHDQEIPPDDDWLEFLQMLTSQTAIAIDNANMLERLLETNLNLTQAYDTTIMGWSKALEFRNFETAGHSQRVTDLTLKLARELGVPAQALEHIRRGALLHDIGKMGIPDHILLKPGELTPEERKIIEKHPVYAYEMLSAIPFLKAALDIPYAHHEKWDGSGYPLGLRGEAIPLAARIFAIVDVFDAMSSDRPYQSARPYEKVIGYIQAQAGKHFDPKIAEVFLALIAAPKSKP
ncbi:MAG: HD domain-containing phosphohydrolase [Chloroflexota bacterium]